MVRRWVCARPGGYGATTPSPGGLAFLDPWKSWSASRLLRNGALIRPSVALVYGNTEVADVPIGDCKHRRARVINVWRLV